MGRMEGQGRAKRRDGTPACYKGMGGVGRKMGKEGTKREGVTEGKESSTSGYQPPCRLQRKL